MSRSHSASRRRGCGSPWHVPPSRDVIIRGGTVEVTGDLDKSGSHGRCSRKGARSAGEESGAVDVLEAEGRRRCRDPGALGLGEGLVSLLCVALFFTWDVRARCVEVMERTARRQQEGTQRSRGWNPGAAGGLACDEAGA